MGCRLPLLGLHRSAHDAPTVGLPGRQAQEISEEISCLPSWALEGPLRTAEQCERRLEPVRAQSPQMLGGAPRRCGRGFRAGLANRGRSGPEYGLSGRAWSTAGDIHGYWLSGRSIIFRYPSVVLT